MNVAVVHIVRSQCLEAAVQDSQYLWQDLPSVVFKESFPSKQECVCVCYICLWSSPWMEIIANSHKVKWRFASRLACLAITVIYQMACILAWERCPLWLCPYEVVALTDTGGEWGLLIQAKQQRLHYFAWWLFLEHEMLALTTIEAPRLVS
jgi:hypothetical protein